MKTLTLSNQTKSLLFLFLLLCLLCRTAATQRPTYPLPPKPLDNAAEPPTNRTSKRPLDFIQLQKEADALSQAAQTIPTDLSSIRQGLMPKDTMQKLKQIEKLSKRLRGELNP